MLAVRSAAGLRKKSADKMIVTAVRHCRHRKMDLSGARPAGIVAHNALVPRTLVIMLRGR